MVNDMLHYLRTVRERPVWQPIPDQVKAHFGSPVPLDPQPPEEIYEEFLENVLPYPAGNIHPRFWGWVVGTGTVLGAFAELLAASMNSDTGAFDSSGNYVEKQVIDWLKEIMGFPASASGLLTSGGSAANLIGLTVARNTEAGFDLRRKGIQSAPRRMVLYASQEIHDSVQRAIEMLGLGSEALRPVPVDGEFQIDLDGLRTILAQDRAYGHQPFCIVGAAGTVNTGAFDDLSGLADICEQEDLWFHVDGAFGAWAALTPGARHQVAGMERADSLAFDMHKWMYVPYAIGCVLVRREEDHRNAFQVMPDYLVHGKGERGISGGDLPWIDDYGFQHSRAFQALKAWMSLKEHGARRYGRLLQQNIDQARYLAELIADAPELELVAPVSLNIVCFRCLRPGLEATALDALNREILVELQEQGIAAPSGTTIEGKYVLRVAITNHRSRREDFNILVREVTRIGSELAQPAA
jgi:glutamate/tyrosine decarboxylase-like PLP-dependent enzyme